ncbi:hypothetical protein HQ496_11370 [bacterium]|nr:hypothetical protein [bacterium]
MITARFAKWNLIAVLALLLLAFFWIDPNGRSSELFRFAGRLHPAIVHLPIGLLIGALFMVVVNRLDWLNISEGAIDLVLLLGTWAGVKAVFLGSWLAQTGGYAEDLLFLHKLMGYGIAVLSAAILFLRTSSPTFNKPALSLVGWAAIVILLVVGGDMGGQLTHGRGFVTEYAPGFVQSMLGNPNPLTGRLHLGSPGTTTVYEGIVSPILANKCTFCHGEGRQNGRLQLHTQEAIEAHEGDEPLIVAGRPEESELIKRVVLPEGHEDQMPPPMRAKPISHADVELLKWWVASGASFDATISDTEMPTSIFFILKQFGLDPLRTGVFALDLPPADSLALASLRSNGLRIDLLAEGESLLSVACGSANACLTTIQEAGVSDLVTWLDLRGSSVTDSDLASLAQFPKLTRLNIAGADIDGSGFEHLVGLEYLEYLNAYDTKVNDAGIAHLASAKQITAVYLWQTAVTQDGINQLREALPKAEINVGEIE